MHFIADRVFQVATSQTRNTFSGPCDIAFRCGEQLVCRCMEHTTLDSQTQQNITYNMYTWINPHRRLPCVLITQKRVYRIHKHTKSPTNKPPYDKSFVYVCNSAHTTIECFLITSFPEFVCIQRLHGTFLQRSQANHMETNIIHITHRYRCDSRNMHDNSNAKDLQSKGERFILLSTFLFRDHDQSVPRSQINDTCL